MKPRKPVHPAPALDAGLRARLDERLALPPGEEVALLARVKARVMARVANEAGPFHTMPASDASWDTIAPGVQRKLLWASGGAQSCLMRLAPGAWVDGHSHIIDEECLVLEGSLRIGADLLLQAGDFHVARQGSSHHRAFTQTGALVFLRGARPPDPTPLSGLAGGPRR